MKTLALTILLASAIWSQAATCKGEDPCKACKDCSQCAYCNSGKGSCGVMRGQSGAQRGAAERKSQKAGRK